MPYQWLSRIKSMWRLLIGYINGYDLHFQEYMATMNVYEVLEGGGGPNLVVIAAYSWFRKWNIILIQ